MADDALSISNRALQHAGARSIIASLDEPSNEAQNVKLIFDSSVREVLSEVRWNFTSTYVEGVTVSGTIPPQWQYAYAVPSDLLVLRAVMAKATTPGAGVPIFGAALQAISSGTGGKVPFALATVGGARAILCNLSSCVVWYSARAADFAMWEPLALAFLEYKLASKLAIPLSGDKALAQFMEQKAAERKAAAQLLDANDDFAQQDIIPDWLLQREGGPGCVDVPGISGGAQSSLSTW